MTRATILLTMATLLCCMSCGTARHSASSSEASDSRLVIRERVEIVPVTVYADIPDIREAVRVRDTTSHLENDYSESDAAVLTDGTLSHTLKTKPQSIPVEAEVQMIYRDSVRTVETFKEVEVIREVPAQLSAWQRWQIRGFWMLLAALLLAAAWKIYRRR